MRTVLGVVWAVMVLWIVAAVLMVTAWRFVPPLTSPLMIQRMAQGESRDWRWLAAEDIPVTLKRAVIAAEDARFCSHAGFDWIEIDDVLAKARDGRPLRGASTLSMQTARILFLPESRTWVRKAVEAGLTMLIEATWPKARILTVYLNTVEWGPGIYGAEAAARHHFGIPASALDADRAARLAAILPNPREWSPTAPDTHVRQSVARIRARAATLPADALPPC